MVWIRKLGLGFPQEIASVRKLGFFPKDGFRKENYGYSPKKILRSPKDYSALWIIEVAFLLASHNCMVELQFPSSVQLHTST